MSKQTFGLSKCPFSTTYITLLLLCAHACISVSVTVPSSSQEAPCGWLINTPGVEQCLSSLAAPADNFVCLARIRL